MEDVFVLHLTAGVVDRHGIHEAVGKTSHARDIAVGSVDKVTSYAAPVVGKGVEGTVCDALGKECVQLSFGGCFVTVLVNGNSNFLDMVLRVEFVVAVGLGVEEVDLPVFSIRRPVTEGTRNRSEDEPLILFGQTIVERTKDSGATRDGSTPDVLTNDDLELVIIEFRSSQRLRDLDQIANLNVSIPCTRVVVVGGEVRINDGVEVLGDGKDLAGTFEGFKVKDGQKHSR